MANTNLGERLRPPPAVPTGEHHPVAQLHPRNTPALDPLGVQMASTSEARRDTARATVRSMQDHLSAITSRAATAASAAAAAVASISDEQLFGLPRTRAGGKVPNLSQVLDQKAKDARRKPPRQ